jgi:hypothetical protein
MMRCPVTGDEVRTPYSAGDTELGRDEFRQNSFNCSSCDKVHRLSDGVTWVAPPTKRRRGPKGSWGAAFAVLPLEILARATPPL